MKNFGAFNAAKDASSFGFSKLKSVHWNFEAPGLYEESLKRGEAMLVKGGALRVDTGIFTGRSPKD